MNVRMFIWSYLKSDEIQLENTNQTRMNREQLDMLYRQQIIDMIHDRVRVDQTRVIPLRRGTLIIYGDDIVDEDDFDSSYTEEEDTEDEGDDIDCESSDDDSMTEDDDDDDTVELSDSDFEALLEKIREENTKDIKRVERIEKKPKKLAKK